MPTPIAHSLAGVLIYVVFAKACSLKENWKWVLFAAFLATAPDFDFIFGWFIGNYNEFHRGISHSIGGCFLVSLALWVGLKNNTLFLPKKIFLFLFCLYGSHLVLDYFCQDSAPPYGAQFFWPFIKEKTMSPIPLLMDAYREPFRAIFSLRNQLIFLSEILLFGIPILIYLSYFRKKKSQTTSP